MSIEIIPTNRYRAVCDKCGRRYGAVARESMAQSDLRLHECGVHRKEHDSTGGFRGILGGRNFYCICGAHYVTKNPGETFKCPEDPALSVTESTESKR